MTIRASDLPANIRARLPQPPPRRKRPAESRDEALSERRCRWRCAYCPETHDRWAPMQRHANDNGHARVEIVFGDPS